MEKIAIAAYSSTCMGIPRILAEFAQTNSKKFSFELLATGSTKVMLAMLLPDEKNVSEADIALFTLSDALLGDIDQTKIRIEATANFSFVAIANVAEIGNRTSVDAEWLNGKNIVTYGGGSAGEAILRDVLGSYSSSSEVAINGVSDTLTVNEVVKAGIAVGVAVGLNEPYDVAPGIKAVPIVPSSASTRWRSYVAIREDKFRSGGLVKDLYLRLLEMDKTESPGWIIANPTLGLHPFHQQLVKNLGQRLNTTEFEIIRQALDLYKLALDEMNRNNLLTVTDPESSISYPIELEVLGAPLERTAS